MRGGPRPKSGRPQAPNLEDSRHLVEFLKRASSFHLHRIKTDRYKVGYMWTIAYFESKLCGSPACLKIPKD